MKTNSISYNLAFASNSIPKLPKEGIRMGYDDAISSTKRASIRDHLEKQTGLAYIDFYEGPKTDYEMESMLKSWGLKTDQITRKIIIPPHLNTISLGNNNFRGALPDSYLGYKTLKESGINTVICATPQRNPEYVVKKYGMEYIELFACNPVHEMLKDYIFEDVAFNEEWFYIAKIPEYYYEDSELPKEKLIEKKKIEFNTKSREFIEKLIKSVNAWQKGACFIGCEFGTGLTNNALSVIDAFNPKGKGIACSYLTHLERDYVSNLYKKLTPEDKKLMNWTKEFESSFLKRFVHI